MGNTSPHLEMAVPDLLAEADRLADDGHGLDAIRRLTEANRAVATPQIEERLVTLRHEVFPSLPVARPKTLPPEVVAREPGGPLPATDPSDLDVATLRRELARHGCVLVRGLIPPERAEALARGIDRALGRLRRVRGVGLGGGLTLVRPVRAAERRAVRLAAARAGCGRAGGCGRPTRPACCSS